MRDRAETMREGLKRGTKERALRERELKRAERAKRAERELRR